MRPFAIGFLDAERIQRVIAAVAQTKGRTGCNCWRCRRAIGVTISRGPRADSAMVAQTLDWLAWTDPDSGFPLTQAVIGDLVGIGQPVVSRLARAVVK